MTETGNTVSVNEEALAWLVRTNDPDFEDWEAFTEWLESDPGNASAYHRLADSEIEMRALVGRIVPPAPIPAKAPARTRRYAIAASLAVVAAAGATILVPRLSPVPYATGPGEQRTLTLAQGDQILMNGGTRLTLAGFDRRTVRLEQGEILLQLHGSGKDKVQVVSGDLELVDVGTVFDVVRDTATTSVTVAEGTVVADPDGARLALQKGSRLDAKDGDTVLRATTVDTASVGAWNSGQLSYRSEPLARVVSDLRRSTGIDFVLQPDMGPQQFTGTLAIAEIRRDPQALAPLLGVTMQRSGKRWEIGGGARD
jgi:transmembrane sensor